MSSLLIKNAQIVTLDPKQPILPKGEILVEGDKIAAVGAKVEAPAGAEVLDTIPGVVPNLLRLPQGCSFSLRCGQCGENCWQKLPELAETEPGHLVRCFLAGKEETE